MKTLLHGLHAFDRAVTAYVQSWPGWVRPFMRCATVIGQPLFTVATGVFIAGVGYGQANLLLIELGVGVIVIILIGSLLKLFLRRKRPLTEYVAAMWFKTFSFPSGHAVGAVAAYGAAAWAVSMWLPSVSWLCAGAGVVVALAIGVSRIYLGAHYPSDVIAGWLVGGAGLIAVMIGVMQ